MKIDSFHSKTFFNYLINKVKVFYNYINSEIFELLLNSYIWKL